MKNPFGKVRSFYKETVVELKKSHWPGPKELRVLTVVVLLGILLIGAFTSLVDFALYNLVELFTQLVQK